MKISGIMRVLVCAVLLCLFVLLQSGCAPGSKPKDLITDKAMSSEGERNPTVIDDTKVAGSDLVPSTSAIISEGVKATKLKEGETIGVEPRPARMSVKKPGSTSTVWSGPLDTWADIAGNVDIEGARAVTTDGNTFEARKIHIDNRSTLEGAAAYAKAVEAQVTAMSADQRTEFVAWVQANADVLKTLSPPLLDFLRTLAGGL